MNISYSAMKSAKWSGRILLDSSAVTVSEIVQTGQVLTFLPEEKAPVYSVKPFPLHLSIPYEDEYIMVIDKPAPLASQSSRNHPDDSLENAVFYHLGCPNNFTYCPVNRLDKGTSGLMLVAKDGHSQYVLQRELHTPDFLRQYTAVVEGIPFPSEDTINAPIAKEPASSVKRIVSKDGKPSVTHYWVEKSGNGRSIVHLQLDTGRTHQIRVHMKYIGCPVAGDFLYGSELPELPMRFALHSSFLHFVHPISGNVMEFTSGLPKELEQIIYEK